MSKSFNTPLAWADSLATYNEVKRKRMRSKTFLLTMCLGTLLCTSFAQAPSAPQASTREDNKALVRAYLDEVSNKGRYDKLDRFFAHGVVFNGTADTTPLLARWRAIRGAFPDHHLVVEDQVAEGDRVVTRVTFRGTHEGTFNGIAATGRRVEYTGVAIDRIVNGKVVEMWHISNTTALIQQLAAGPVARP